MGRNEHNESGLRYRKLLADMLQRVPFVFEDNLIRDFVSNVFHIVVNYKQQPGGIKLYQMDDGDISRNGTNQVNYFLANIKDSSLDTYFINSQLTLKICLSDLFKPNKRNSTALNLF